MLGRHGQPGFCRTEAAMRRVSHPRHRRAAAVAALELGPERDAVRVLQRLERNVRFRQGQLVALVQARRAFQRRLHGQHHLGQRGRRIISAPARHDAHAVVVAHGPGSPAVGHLRFEFFHLRADVRGGKFRRQQVETVSHVQLVGARVGGHGGERIVVAHFTDGNGLVFIEHGAHALQVGDVFRLRLVVHVRLHAVRVDGRHAAGVALRGWWIVAQQLVVIREVAGIEAEAIDTAFQPEAQVVQLRLLHGRVMEIQVGLAGEEIVQEVLAAARLPLPGGTAEHGQPVVWRRAIGFLVGPHIPVGLGIVAAGAAFHEPRVDVGRVRQHLVDHHFQAQFMGARHQAVEIGQAAEHGIDVAEVGHVVAEVFHRRGEEGRDPDDVGAQGGDVIELGGNAGQVADAVAIAVEEAAWVDLVDDGAAPPVGGQVGEIVLDGRHE